MKLTAELIEQLRSLPIGETITIEKIKAVCRPTVSYAFEHSPCSSCVLNLLGLHKYCIQTRPCFANTRKDGKSVRFLEVKQ